MPVIEKVSGDTQKTIFERYSHMFDDDDGLVLDALENLRQSGIMYLKHEG